MSDREHADGKDIDGLRARLFATIDAVREGKLDLNTARVVAELSREVINTAKVEVEYLKASGGGESTFLNSAVGSDNLPAGITGVTRHRLK